MVRCVRLCFGMLVRLFFRRQSLLLENLALRQLLVMLKRRHPRPSLGLLDKLFWVIARRVWSGWKQALLVVTPETVVRWHRAGFRMYWRLISRVQRQVGRLDHSRKNVEKFRWRGLVGDLGAIGGNGGTPIRLLLIEQDVVLGPGAGEDLEIAL